MSGLMAPGPQRIGLMTRGAARRRIFWHHRILGHCQEVHHFEVPSTSILGQMTFCSCGRVWCV